MRMEGLSFDNLPAIHIPFRFFNTAPWMGVLAACILIFSDPSVFISQWSPQLLAMTHLLTLGFMLMIMFGALFQLLPVISGITIPKARIVAPFVHSSLLLGIFLLVLGFLNSQYLLFIYALPVLAFAVLVFVVALGARLRHQIRGGNTIFALRLAVICLLFTLGLGVIKALNYLGYGDVNSVISLSRISNLHIVWGLMGWSLLLVIGISYQLIPMFHVTPKYNAKLAKVLPVMLFSCLLATTFIEQAMVVKILIITISLLSATYAGYALFLLHNRKRKIKDLTVYFWRLALVCLFLLTMLLLASQIINLPASVGILLGALAIYGFLISVIMGMLQKIIPFLSYLHLQRQCMACYELLPSLPNMREIISEKKAVWQFRLHLTGILMVSLAIIMPQFLLLSQLAGFCMLIDFIYLGFNVALASRLYHQHTKRITAHINKSTKS